MVAALCQLQSLYRGILRVLKTESIYIFSRFSKSVEIKAGPPAEAVVAYFIHGSLIQNKQASSVLKW